ncbi:MAG TPA: glycosyltransferase family 39 protein [Acidobacteriaceae bacterium]|nr:glycosyltransferase family 39 protein [Acidobacteriaceae bacterium]
MNMDPIATASRGKRTTITAAIFLILTAIISLVLSHHKLMSQDEFFVLQTDNAATISQLIHIQRTAPISLDPLTYHLLAHASMRVFGIHAFTLRLPSFLGYLLMQVCLFVFVRRIAGDRAAIFALAFPALTATLLYSAEARPYGLLLGLYALTLVAWQSAIHRPTHLSFRNAVEESASAPTEIVGTANRWPSLVLLTLSIALTLNAHYFGILLLIPLCAAELARTFHRRRIDFPVVAAILLGMAGIVFALPFQSAAAEFREHYYNGGTVGLRAISQSYRSLFVDYTHTSLLAQRILAILFVLCALALIAACVRRYRSGTLPLPFPESVFIFTLAALPFFGFLLARFVTHSIEVRYVLGAIIGITILLAAVLAPTLRRSTNYALALVLLFFAILTAGLLRIDAASRDSDEIRASLILSPQQKAALLASPTQLLYIQDMGHFEVASYYEPDLIVASHMALLYSRDEELRWDGHDTVSLTAMHMRDFTGFTIVPWDRLRAQPGPHILILMHSGWDWTDQALAESHAEITPLGPAMGGDAVSVTFQR